MPKISIITVNLNNLKGLQKTMDSVFKQSWQEFEYLVIDGGSTDGSREFIEEHTTKIDYWVSELDKGIYSAMNKGIRMAKGEYLLFLNSGDWLYNNDILGLIVEKLLGCDVLYGNMIKVYPDGREVSDKGVNGGEISLRTFIEGTINHSASFINKGMFKKYGLYDEELRIVSDWKFFLISLGLNNSTIFYIDLPISYFDMTGISNDRFDLRVRERNLVLKEKVPLPVYNDYLKLKEYKKTLHSRRIRKFLKTDEKRISKKLHSIIFKLFS